MDRYHGYSAYRSSNPFRGIDGATPEDKSTHRRWARAVLAFYSCLFVLGVVTIELKHVTASSQGLETHAALRSSIAAAH